MEVGLAEEISVVYSGSDVVVGVTKVVGSAEKTLMVDVWVEESLVCDNSWAL